jgi:hypothetical protein
MNDLATITPKVRITELGLDILEDLTFDEWASLAAHFGKAVRSMEFVIGDWLVYGDRFAVQLPLPGFPADKLRRAESERYEKALETTRLDRLTLRNFAYVCRNVGKSCRHDYLSFEHHRALATLDETGQQHWIAVARAENDAGRHMSVRRLRRSIEAGRVLAVEELSPDKCDMGLSNHIPFVNGLVGWWSRMTKANWLRTASAEKRAALKRDLQPIVKIYEEL